MALRTVRTVNVDRPLEAVASYLSDFTTSAEWDPHTVSCRQLDEGPLQVGTRFENVQKIAGRRTGLTYGVTEYVPYRKIVLRGGNDTISTQDTMTFKQLSDGTTQITYRVDPVLHGAAKVATPLLLIILQKVARDAARQMPKTLRAAVSAPDGRAHA